MLVIPPIYERPKWKYALEGLTFIALLIASIELVFDPILDALFPTIAVFFNIIELMIVTTIFFDLALRMIDAKSRYSFLKRNSFSIFLTFPLAIILKTTQLAGPVKITLIKASGFVASLLTSRLIPHQPLSKLAAFFRIRF
ncbi:MAG TPA: hypothetical protein VJH24_03150 [Candidatus Bilamarchaeaceae archaeon]|nr:hypothetical protein [Candidatus Bilamarchaeaceae archaeon]